MAKFDTVPCTILSDAVVNTEQPFTMTFDVRINGDQMEAMFMGEFARQLRNNVRVGDRGVIREATVHGNRIAFTFMHLEPDTALGRNLNMYG